MYDDCQIEVGGGGVGCVGGACLRPPPGLMTEMRFKVGKF